MVLVNNANATVLDSLPTDTVLCVAVCSSTKNHYRKSSLSFVYVNDLKGSEYVIGVTHSDLPSNSPTILRKLNKYTVVCLDSRLISEYVDCYDLEVLHWYFTNSGLPDFVKQNDTVSTYVKLNRTVKNLVNFIPIFTLVSQCQVAVSYYNLTLADYRIENGSKYYNHLVFRNLVGIEQNGIAINTSTDLQHGLYNITTTTGRPSNHYGGVNYMSLNKTDGTRAKYISRFTKGKLVEVDFKSFHPWLIAKLIQYDFKGDNPYRYLAKQYYHTQDPTPQQIDQAKKLTFSQMYGTVDPMYGQIPFFIKITEKVEQLWQQLNKEGYIETPIAKRKMYKDFYEQLNRTKLFNYYLQAFETEYMAAVLNKVNSVLVNYNSKIVLYLYDCFVLDFDYVCDSLQVLQDIYNHLDALGLQYTVKIGTNYNDMQPV